MALGDFRSVFLPYCLQKQSDGRYAVLNREYKPVGFFTKKHITYQDHPILVRFKRLTAATAKKVSIDAGADDKTIYLYNDNSNPVRSKANMAAYLARLEILAKLQIKREA